MDIDALRGNMERMYENVAGPIILTDDNLNIVWANRIARKQYASFILPCGIEDLVKNCDREKILTMLRKGNPTLLRSSAEPIDRKAFRLIPILEEEKLVGCQCIGIGQEESWDSEIEESERIVAAYSNEYKVPLMIIFSTLGLLGRRTNYEEEPEIRTYLKLIAQNCYRLLRLSNNISELARLRSGISTLRLRNGDICRYVSGLCEAAGILTGALDIPLESEIPSEPIFCVFDPNKLSVVLYNIISNSCKYTREGNRIKIRVEKKENSAVITVSDRGIGIKGEILDKIFEPYFSYSSEDVPFRGAGLGLCLAKHIIIQHGGTIAVNSKENAGTTVAFTLPARLNDSIPDYTAERGADYLSDRFSQLYIELSDVCGCPLP